MMYLKLILLSIILIVFFGLALGLKALFGKKEDVKIGCSGGGDSCGCGGGTCHTSE